MMKPYSFLWILLLVSAVSFAQQGDRPDRCHAAEIHEEKMLNDPDYAAAYLEKMAQVKLWLKNNESESKSDCDEILFIPVAVHFQRTDGADLTLDYNCAVEMALSQIDAINADFAATNTDIDKWENGQSTWPSIQNKPSCIQFCLATLDHPDGSGIAEGDYAVTLNEYDDIDNIPEWSGYMNWFVRDITNPLGYSPLGGSGNGDGVVCGLAYFGTSNCNGNLSGTFGLGRTITHEVGHYLTLPHPFDSGECLTDGDNIADTPLTDQATFGCFPDGESFVNCDEPVLWPTYMEYCDDACLYMWTEDQVDQMEAYVNTGLSNLLNSASIKCEDAACVGFDLDLTAQDESCFGNDGSISISLEDGSAPFQYSINGGFTFQDNGNFQNLTEGEYDVYVIDSQGCELIDSVSLERDIPPITLVSKKNAFCGDNSGSLTVEVNFDDDFEYSIGGGWQDTSFFSGLNPGTYEVVARNSTNCTNSIDVVIGDDSDLNLRINRLRPVNCPLFDNGLIDAELTNGVEPFVYTLDDLQPSDRGFYENLSAGNYVLAVQDDRGCRLEYPFPIEINFATIGEDCPCQVYIPTAMTPDGDGLNDVFKAIPSCPITEYHLQIFDRWGDLVFESRNMDEVWNGGENEYFAGSQVFFYRLSYRWGEEFNESLELQIETGTITTVR